MKLAQQLGFAHEPRADVLPAPVYEVEPEILEVVLTKGGIDVDRRLE